MPGYEDRGIGARPRRVSLNVMARIVALLVAGSGVLNLLSLVGRTVATQAPGWLQVLFPLDFAGVSRTLTLISGFLLILTALHLWACKQRAWRLAVQLAAASVLFHLVPLPSRNGWNLEEAASSGALLAVFWLSRSLFAVGAEPPHFAKAALRAGFAFTVAAAYGAVGFWLLEPVEFHHNFQWWESAWRTIRLMLFIGDSTLVPHTPYAAWFSQSLFWISGSAILYSGFVLFRPVVYRFQVNRAESALAQAIAEQYGRSGLDFFKHRPDKSYFFTPNGHSFIGYRVSGSFALALGDPVGPEDEAASTIVSFRDFCRSRGWRVGFHQVSGDRLALYESLGFQRLKVGDEAIVDLDKFTLSGSAMKEFRNTVNRLDRLGYRVERIDPPICGALLDGLERISNQWLEIPGHRERQFTLGRFERKYIQETPVYVAFDASGDPVAFLNLVPSYDPAVATVDLMRRSPRGASGLMDYLFAKAFLDLKARGIRSFDLGMAPLSGTAGDARLGREEKLVHWAIRRMPFLFRAESLRQFKAKYADSWYPRYAVYQKRMDLPRLALALHRISEVKQRQTELYHGEAA